MVSPIYIIYLICFFILLAVRVTLDSHAKRRSPRAITCLVLFFQFGTAIIIGQREQLEQQCYDCNVKRSEICGKCIIYLKMRLPKEHFSINLCIITRYYQLKKKNQYDQIGLLSRNKLLVEDTPSPMFGPDLTLSKSAQAQAHFFCPPLPYSHCFIKQKHKNP